MELTKDVVSMETVTTEAGEEMECVDTRAAASAIMDRMEERAAALRLLAGLDPEAERYVVERETRKGRVVFTVKVREADYLLASASAVDTGNAGVGWVVSTASLHGDSPMVAVASAVCLLLAASVAAEKSRS